jgi:hypothetical protein
MATQEGGEKKKKAGNPSINLTTEGVKSSGYAFYLSNAPKNDCSAPQENNLLGSEGAQ